MIIIEGCDKTGKSTLARHLSRAHDCPLVHCGPPSAEWYEEYASFLINIKNNVICDRSFLGQFVYGPILRQARFDEVAFYNLVMIAARHNPIFIFSNTDDKRIAHKFLEDKEDLIDINQIKSIQSGFSDVFKRLKMCFPGNTYGYDYSRYDGTSGIIDFCDSLRRDVPPSLDFKFLGSSTPRVLMVGEKLNKANQKWENALPFDFGRSADLLRQSIPLSMAVRNAYVNALDGYDLSVKVKKMCPQKVVALGKVASDECSRHGIDHISMAHPAYIMRFPDIKKSITTADWQQTLRNHLTN